MQTTETDKIAMKFNCYINNNVAMITTIAF